jgi:hypothetical protein
MVGGGIGAAVLAIGSLTLATPASAAASGTTAADQRCAKPLPASVIGAPALAAGQASGARVWHDRAGWHLRFTHPGKGAQVFSGVVHSPQPITAHGYRLEKQDSLSVSDHGHTLTFRLVNHGAVDGIDFTDRCAINTGFTLVRDGQRLPTTSVFLGAASSHPTSSPFLVQRSK